MSRIEGLFKRFYRTPETVAEERRREEAAHIEKRCKNLVDEVYGDFERSFHTGSKKVTTYTSMSETIIECAKKRLESDGLVVTYYLETEYAHGKIIAEYKK